MKYTKMAVKEYLHYGFSEYVIFFKNTKDFKSL